MIPKFRAWDYVWEKMFTLEQITSIDFENNCIEYKEYFEYSNGDKGYVYEEKSLDELWLMQSTRLLDKNGVEIYEGDIVMHMGSLYTPVYERAIYMAYDVKQFNLNNKEPITQFNCIWRDDGCEIVGNTYENKELLQ